MITYYSRKFKLEITVAFICLFLGMLSGISVKASDSLWYINLNKPFFNPPNWIFAPTWSLLYLIIGFIFGNLLKSYKENKYLINIFVMQFIINLAWSPIFFYFNRMGIALLALSCIWLLSLIFLIYSRKYILIFLFFMPYFFWITFALILNYNIYILNV